MGVGGSVLGAAIWSWFAQRGLSWGEFCRAGALATWRNGSLKAKNLHRIGCEKLAAQFLSFSSLSGSAPLITRYREGEPSARRRRAALCKGFMLARCYLLLWRWAALRPHFRATLLSEQREISCRSGLSSC